MLADDLTHDQFYLRTPSSGRLFSKAGSALNQQRNKLKAFSISKLVCRYVPSNIDHSYLQK